MKLLPSDTRPDPAPVRGFRDADAPFPHQRVVRTPHAGRTPGPSAAAPWPAGGMFRDRFAAALRAHFAESTGV